MDEFANAINLTELHNTVNDHFQKQCQLTLIGTDPREYDIVLPGGPVAVVRVAHPDDVASEVATMKYLASYGIPLPEIYAWDSKTDKIGAGYMIMEKVPGQSAEEVWRQLPLEDKERIVTQVARYLLAAFQARFDQAGSLYLSHLMDTPNPFYVGPIASYRFMDGRLLYSDKHVAEGVQKFRGPFSNTTDWLSCSLRAEIFALKSKGDQSFDADAALANMDAAVRLCSVYPGDNPVIPHITSPDKPFSFKFADIGLKDIMVDDSCQITSFINFKCTGVAPLWACATVPSWLLPDEDTDAWSICDGPYGDENILCEIFFSEIAQCPGGKEWRDAHRLGRGFRKFLDQLDYPAGMWTGRGTALYLQKIFDWACRYPGVHFPNGKKYFEFGACLRFDQ